jgi:hypothetical protein
MFFAWIFLLAGGIFLVCPTGHAVEGGYSNYLPGTYGDFAMAVEPPDSWTLRNDLYYYNADEGQTVRSGQIEVEADLSFIANFTTILYKPDVQILGAQYAFGAFVPIMYADIESSVSLGPGNPALTFSDDADAFGLGDIALMPWVLYWHRGNLHTSFAQYVVVPTGDYDANDSINTGLNYWSFDTNLALTYLNPDNGWEFSANLGYIYNTENSDTDYKSGQEIHLDYAINRYLSETLAVGLQGFYLRQISGDSGDGAVLGSFKAEAAGIGPALFWATQIDDTEVSFIVKWLHEFEAERRMEGDHLMASFALGF